MPKNTIPKHALERPDFTIETLGKPTFVSPLKELFGNTEGDKRFVLDNEQIVYNADLETIKRYMAEGEDPPSMEVAGPREKIFFNPDDTRAAIVTCGGLCPGLNDVVRALFMGLHFRYQIKSVIGIRYGYAGLVPRIGMPPLELKQNMVENMQTFGGSMLGSSRGPQDPKEMVDFLERERVNILFTIGGDGTMGGALALAEEIERRKLEISIVGIPKTIDNDIGYIERTFGFQTAVSIAKEVLAAGHEEARGAMNGVAVVKLMGRDSGSIAAMAAVANGDANFVLVPEVPFDMDGEKGFLRVLERRLQDRRHALVVVAEGAGKDIMEREHGEKTIDPSGNVKVGDIGVYLRDRISKKFRTGWNAATVKYIDPSYIIRSAAANSDDSIFCNQLSHNAIHAAMSGRTKLLIGIWNNTFTHVPMATAISRKKQLDIEGGTEWLSVLETTGQPVCMKNEC